MGLDIVVYTGPLVETTVTAGRNDDGFYDEISDRGLLKPSNYNGYDRLAPLELEKIYAAKTDYGFRAGSYGGYNRYREALCELALGVTPETVWNDPEAYADQPFFEQICFGDNEDTIGAEACKRLANAYDAYRTVARDKFEGEGVGFLWESYQEWREAFRVAAESGGAVDYR